MRDRDAHEWAERILPLYQIKARLTRFSCGSSEQDMFVRVRGTCFESDMGIPDDPGEFCPV